MKSAWTFVGVAAASIVVALAVTPWTLKGAARRAAIVEVIRRDVGVDVRVRGPMTVKLLPRPRVRIAEVSLTTPDGTIDVSAPALSADFDIASLFGASWRLVSATLSSPTATIDIDQAVRHRDDFAAPPVRLSVRSGVMRLVSKSSGTDALLTDLNGTVERMSARGALSASGTAVWRGVPGQIMLRLGEALEDGTIPHRDADLKITSPAGSFSASGDLANGAQPQFAGQISAASSTPDRLLAAFGARPPWADIKRFAIRGQAQARQGDISLSEASLVINGIGFDGTLGYHADHGRGLVEGTLATGKLDVEELIGHSLDPALMRRIYATDIAPGIADLDLDLRISAATAAIGDAHAQDVALSLLCQDRSLEVTLDEALAFDGVLKARLSGRTKGNAVEAHADLAASGVELGALGVALTGQQRMTGLLTGRIAVDGRGRALTDIVPSLEGNGEVSVDNGEFMGLSVSQALKRFTRNLPFGADQPGQVTAFASASSAIRITAGLIDFVDGKVTGPGVSLAFAGHGDLPRGNVDILAMASPTDASGSLIAGAAGLPIEMRGSWGEPLMLMERRGHIPFPGVSLPTLEPGQLLP